MLSTAVDHELVVLNSRNSTLVIAFKPTHSPRQNADRRCRYITPMSDADRARGQIHSIRGGKDGSPPPEGPVRRIAAILAADISGYSRLMQLDEEGTYAHVMRQRRELIEPSITEHHGKLINYAGDGFLAMFDSPVEAVRCAIVIRQGMVGRNASLPREQWILYRIGVHLGDVIVQPDGVFGDGVNIAARLEGIATPGDVFISGGVYEQIKNKLVCAYQALGDRQVKNITDPVTVYRVLPDPAALSQARRQRWPVGPLAVLIIGVIAILGGWYLLLLQKQLANQAPTFAGSSQTPGVPGETAKNPQPLPAPAQGPLERPKESSSPTPAIAPIAAQLMPEMVSIPAGTFAMGSEDDPSEKPMHRVTIKPFAISKFPITVREWNACVAAKSCSYVLTGKDDAPVANLSWADAQQFVEWLSKVTQKPFRLPSYAASTRPNTTPIFLHATSRSLTLRVMPREFCRFALPIPLSPKPILATHRGIRPVHRATPSPPSDRACRTPP
jgi:class 3 adenylate cyclase